MWNQSTRRHTGTKRQVCKYRRDQDEGGERLEVVREEGRKDEKGDKNEESKKEESTFSSQEIRTALRLHPSQFSRYMKQLKERGYIQQVKGKGKGSTYRYKVVIWDDYQLLKAGVAKMDEVIKELKKRAKSR